MNTEFPSKRNRLTSLSISNNRKSFKEIHLLLLSILKSEPLPPWFEINSSPNSVFLIFLPYLDLETLEQHSEEAPFLYSFIQDNTRWCKVETQSNNGFLSDFLRIFDPVAIENPPVEGLDQFLVTEDQLKANNYPVDCSKATSQQGTTKGLIALDCEMVKTTRGLELAKVSLLSESELLYDHLVMPAAPVVDYLTQFSGITPQLLSTAFKTLESAQTDFLNLVNESAVICGHSLENDLKALNIFHSKIADVSLLYPHQIIGRKLSLKVLSKKYLKRSIQENTHNSIEDAQAALDLFKLKLKKGPKFGMPDFFLKQRNFFQSLSESSVRSVVVGTSVDSQFIQGSVSIDPRGSVKKYLKTDYRLIFSIWDDLKKIPQNDSKKELEKTLKKWDKNLKELVESLEGGLVVLMNGEGNSALADR